MNLTIRDCSLAFKGFYSPACIFERSRIERLATSMLERFSANNLQPTDLTLDTGDELYRYLLRVTLFNRLTTFAISAQTAEANFTRLLSQADRALAANCLDTMVNVSKDGLSDHCYVEANVHASFTSPAEREEFFSRRVTDGIDMAGILGYKSIGNPDQLVRIEIDQSWVYPDAAYLVWKTIGMPLARVVESPLQLWDIMFDVTQPLGLEFLDE
jgi:hypothetical protein